MRLPAVYTVKNCAGRSYTETRFKMIKRSIFKMIKSYSGTNKTTKSFQTYLRAYFIKKERKKIYTKPNK